MTKDIFSAPCAVALHPTGCHVKEDARNRGLWFYTGDSVEEWNPGEAKAVLLHWRDVGRMETFLRGIRKKRVFKTPPKTYKHTCHTMRPRRKLSNGAIIGMTQWLACGHLSLSRRARAQASRDGEVLAEAEAFLSNNREGWLGFIDNKMVATYTISPDHTALIEHAKDDLEDLLLDTIEQRLTEKKEA